MLAGSFMFFLDDVLCYARAWNGQAKGAGFAGKLSTAGWSGVIAFSATARPGNLPLGLSATLFP